jgi:hypothetical protein
MSIFSLQHDEECVYTHTSIYTSCQRAYFKAKHSYTSHSPCTHIRTHTHTHTHACMNVYTTHTHTHKYTHTHTQEVEVQVSKDTLKTLREQEAITLRSRVAKTNTKSSAAVDIDDEYEDESGSSSFMTPPVIKPPTPVSAHTQAELLQALQARQHRKQAQTQDAHSESASHHDSDHYAHGDTRNHDATSEEHRDPREDHTHTQRPDTSDPDSGAGYQRTAQRHGPSAVLGMHSMSSESESKSMQGKKPTERDEDGSVGDDELEEERSAQRRSVNQHSSNRCVYVCMCVCMYVYVHVCVCVCMCMCVYELEQERSAQRRSVNQHSSNRCVYVCMCMCVYEQQ